MVRDFVFKYRTILYVLFSVVLLTSCTPTSTPLEQPNIEDTSLELSENVREEVEDSIEVIIGTFLGNDQRNYYGDSIGLSLNEKWKLKLGSGATNLAGGQVIWHGAGWTGQPLVVRESDQKFLLLGCYDHNLKKINATTGQVVWSYAYDDVIKGTGSIWHNIHAANPENRFVILQGSRLGNQNSLAAPKVYSYRGVSYFTGKELWRMNSPRSQSYSRDVDASAITIGDTAYIGLENGSFISFGPGNSHLTPIESSEFYEPTIFQKLPLYTSDDVKRHGGNLVTEASPARIGNRIFISSGSGHVYGYNLDTKTMDWQFDIGSDLDGSPVVTSDSCILVTVEKQYISGHGGVFKLNPFKERQDCVEWYFPTGDRNFADWKGGIIGSVSVNDAYNQYNHYPTMAAFIGIDGELYIVDHSRLDETKTCLGPNEVKQYPMPKLIEKRNIGPSISTPIFVQNKLVAAGYSGIHIFEFNTSGKIINSVKKNGVFEACPVADNGNIYIASRNGYLYCFGEDTPSSVDNAVEAAPVPDTLPAMDSDSDEESVPEIEIDPVETAPAPIAMVSMNATVIDKLRELTKDLEPISLESTSPSTAIPDKVHTLKSGYYLVAGAYSIKDNAIGEVIRYRSIGVNAYIAKGRLDRNYIVVGEAQSKNEIKQLQNQLIEKWDLDIWVYHK